MNEMNPLDPSEQMKLLVLIIEHGLENEEFLSKVCDLYNCSQAQLKIVLKSVIYDYRKKVDGK